MNKSIVVEDNRQKKKNKLLALIFFFLVLNLLKMINGNDCIFWLSMLD